MGAGWVGVGLALGSGCAHRHHPPHDSTALQPTFSGCLPCCGRSVEWPGRSWSGQV